MGTADEVLEAMVRNLSEHLHHSKQGISNYNHLIRGRVTLVESYSGYRSSDLPARAQRSNGLKYHITILSSQNHYVLGLALFNLHTDDNHA